jgi:hypothetical protein
VHLVRYGLLAVATALGGCGSGPTEYIGSQELATCATTPSAPPAQLNADPFYAKYVDAHGIPVLSSAAVDDAALTRACEIALAMLAAHDDVRREMIADGARIAVMGQSELLTDLPDFRDLGPDWTNERGRGATLDNPVSGAAEENLLCLPGDPYQGEKILVHSFAHAMRSLGIIPLDSSFDPQLSADYDAALAAGKWTDTFAATNYPQYWAEGVQDWFDANLEASPADGIHNEINTRDELRAYDPALAELIARDLPDSTWRPSCL